MVKLYSLIYDLDIKYKNSLIFYILHWYDAISV